MASLPQPLIVELSVSERNPPVGWVRTDHTRRRFGGWLELISLLEAIIGGEAGDPRATHAHNIVQRGRRSDTENAC